MKGEKNILNNSHSQFLDRNNARILSPSAINTWLNCRMKFFYRYVNRLKEPENISADIDPAMLGNILHEIMRNLYHDYKGQDSDRRYALFNYQEQTVSCKDHK